MIGTLVALLFAVPDLSWTAPHDHFEAFSGGMSVTKAEWRAPVCLLLCLFWLEYFGVVWFSGSTQNKDVGVLFSRFVTQGWNILGLYGLVAPPKIKMLVFSHFVTQGWAVCHAVRCTARQRQREFDEQ